MAPSLSLREHQLHPPFLPRFIHPEILIAQWPPLTIQLSFITFPFSPLFVDFVNSYFVFNNLLVLNRELIRTTWVMFIEILIH